MHQRGLKPAALAREIGLSHVAVGNWLKDEKPSIPDAYQLLKLAKHFGVTMEWLLTGEEPSGVQPSQLSSPPRLTRVEIDSVRKEIDRMLSALAKKI